MRFFCGSIVDDLPTSSCMAYILRPASPGSGTENSLFLQAAIGESVRLTAVTV